MRTGEGPQVTAKDDRRVTTVGRFLRKTKLDELPELWNVLSGEMSLVGPRPEVERYVDRESEQWKAVLSVRPGITETVTLKLRSEEVLLANVKTDREQFYLEVLQPFKLRGYLEYLSGRTWRSDLLVLYRTIVAVIFPRTTPVPSLDELTVLTR